MSFYYEIDIIQDIIVCTIRHKETDTMEAVAVFRSFTPESIEIEKADLYRNCSNYPYRTETADRYMRKYDQIACIVHGAITAGLLFDTAEAPTSEETPEPVQTTTTTENEPENGTQAAKTTDMETFKKEYSRIYNHLYEHEGQPGVDATRRKYSRLFDESWEDIKDIVKAFCQKSGDLLTSDRQCAAFMKALETVGTPQDATQGTETMTGEETPTDGEKTPYSATDEATTGGKTIIDGKKITTDGTTDGGNRITGGKNITPPRHACEIAPGRTERAQAVPTTAPPRKRPPRGKTQDRHTTTGSRGHPEKSYFFRPDAKNGSDPPKI